MKKAIAIVLAGILFISAIFVFPGRDSSLPAAQEVLASERNFEGGDEGSVASVADFDIDTVLDGHVARGGYVLAPTMLGARGIDALSSFVLRSPAPYGVGGPAITIEGQPAPSVVREDNNTFIITPAFPLTPNSVYVLTLNDEIFWAFQTDVLLEITGTLPRNQAINVPVRTGIEVTFSFGEHDISDDFRIAPHVDGRFIQRDSTAIFVPATPLSFGTVYTVRVRGITFSFETEPEPSVRVREPRNATVQFSGRYVEFPSFATPVVHFWLSHSTQHDRMRPAVDMNVYRFDDLNMAVSAVNRLAGAPWWTYFSHSRYEVDTSVLTRVSSETITERQPGRHWYESYTLPYLPIGFYVLNAVIGGEINSQIILQITDTAVQIIADESRALVWVNDMHTGMAAAGARVTVGNEVFVASSYGIAVVERDVAVGEYIMIEVDGIESVVFAHHGGFQHFWGWSDWEFARRPGLPGLRTNHTIDQYWSVLQLDRTLFQRSDTVNLWGFVQGRRDTEITHVTAVLTEHSWWWDEGGRDTLLRQNIPVMYGAYNAEINLPHLSPGSYEIVIFHGDVALNSIFLTVMDYVTPPYRMVVSADQAAIFARQEVTFTANTQFFEGTPVPDLGITHDFWAWELLVNAPRVRTAATDIDGNMSVTVTPSASSENVQGERQVTFSAEATLPEIGWVHQSTDVRVFVNDIHARPRAFRDGADATLSIATHDIYLGRLNDGTAVRWDDFLGEPTVGQIFDVQIYEIWWERVRSGEFYCHVTRETVPRYRHTRRQTRLQTFSMTSGADGVATHDFTVPNVERRSYEARITTTDGNGRTIRHNVFIGRNFESFFQRADDDSIFLYGARAEGYNIGDVVELTVMRGAEPVSTGNFLFVVVQGDILSYHIGSNPLELEFTERHVPNAQVFAYHFNGHTYNSGGHMSQRLRFNLEEREILITVETCSETYRPGETPTFTVTTTDADGNPIATNVNISLVDEALFSLMDYSVDTLSMLYLDVSDVLRFSLTTHRTFVSDGIEEEWGDRLMTRQVDYAAGFAMGIAAPAASPGGGFEAESAEHADDGQRGGQIRQRFEDTAMFVSVRTNAQGVATFAMPLPDNITSWRVTASAVSECLHAGNTVQTLRVTLPMFLHYTMASVFLVGDIPTIGVNAFGTALGGGEQVEFRVWREDSPDDVRTAMGVAFERVNIPLWEKSEEGFGAIIIDASVAGFSDAVRHEYQVTQSHRMVDTTVFYEVVAGMTFDANATGLTSITFLDHGRGRFLHDLFNLRHTWWGGARVESLVAAREANALIQRHFPDINLFRNVSGFEILDYQTQSGGMAILPHSSAELEVTAKLLPFIKEEIDIQAMRRYLRNIVDNSATDNKILALYGLALLGEPVLLDLQAYALLDNLSMRNLAYVGLGFAALGDMHSARDIYVKIIPHIQAIAPYYRVNASGSRVQIVADTMAVSLLAARLGEPQAQGMFEYANAARMSGFLWDWRGRPNTRFMNEYLLMRLERLHFISMEIENHSPEGASITYTLFGETVTRQLGHGGSFNLRIPAQNLATDFALVSVTGEVGAVSIVRIPMEDIEPIDNNVTVRRQFFRAGTNTPVTEFAQDELIRVEITVNYGADDVGGTYVITDFLPAGLTLVRNSARIVTRSTSGRHHAWATTEGQRVTFHDHNERFNRIHTYFYYARVVNPGTFRAEGTVVQSLGVREYIVVGECVVVVIE
ncbi:MAG: hypothetical protein FWF78_03310 [Defluviitaleaceae bacterium]|nr:hypothetical protein [Defluviitaleaceae bacterium]